METHAPTRQPAAVHADGVPGAVAERLQGLLDGLVARKGIHHAILAVERGDGTFRWVGAAGVADTDGRPMRPDTPYWLASVTKLHIAAAVLKLHERGRIELDAPISTYLPRSLIEGIHRVDGADRTQQITVRHLVSHTSGLADYLIDAPKGKPSLWDRLWTESDRPIPVEEATRIVRDELTPHFAPQPPGASRQKAHYSDTNFRLLIAIIEAVTGRPLAEAFAELLFQPLDLRRTWVPGDRPIAQVPTPAAFWVGDEVGDRPRCLSSLSDLYSTADDSLAFLRAVISGHVFDDPATASLMQGGWNTFGFSLSPTPRSPTWPIEYALGIMRLRMPRFLRPFFRTAEIIGHTGVSGSWLFHSPEHDLFMAGTVDQTAAAPLPFRFVPKVPLALT